MVAPDDERLAYFIRHRTFVSREINRAINSAVAARPGDRDALLDAISTALRPGAISTEQGRAAAAAEKESMLAVVQRLTEELESVRAALSLSEARADGFAAAVASETRLQEVPKDAVKEERVALLHRQAMLRVMNASLALGWTAWYEYWTARKYALGRLREASNRLRKPELAEAFSWWAGAWEQQKRVAQAAAMEAQNRKLETHLRMAQMARLLANLAKSAHEEEIHELRSKLSELTKNAEVQAAAERAAAERAAAERAEKAEREAAEKAARAEQAAADRIAQAEKAAAEKIALAGKAAAARASVVGEKAADEERAAEERRVAEERAAKERRAAEEQAVAEKALEQEAAKVSRSAAVKFWSELTIDGLKVRAAGWGWGQERRKRERGRLVRAVADAAVTAAGPSSRASWRANAPLQTTPKGGGGGRGGEGMRGGGLEAEEGAREKSERAPELQWATPRTTYCMPH